MCNNNAHNLYDILTQLKLWVRFPQLQKDFNVNADEFQNNYLCVSKFDHKSICVQAELCSSIELLIKLLSAEQNL